MVTGISSNETSAETGTTSAQAHLMTGWKMAESDDPTTKLERREIEQNRGGTCSGDSGAHF
jgi:hypothetical protein